MLGTLNIPIEFWKVLGSMSPYLLLGFLVAGALSVLISPEFIERHLGGHGIWPVIKASAFGVPLPLCSCGVIPVAASLRRHGAGKGPTVGFLISTPQTGVDSIFVTFSLLGGAFALFRPLAALVSGIVGGQIVSTATRWEDRDASGRQQCAEACCTGDHRGRLRHIFSYGFLTLPRDIGPALLVGLLAAAVISAVVQENFFASVLGGGIGAMLIMMLLGVPVYVCATASVPVAAVLIAKGVSPGAALVFLMTGPATNAATIATVWRLMGRRTAIIYLLTVALSAVAAGLLLDYIFTMPGIKEPGPAMAGMLPDYVRHGSAVVLLGVLGVGIVAGRRNGSGGEDTESSGAKDASMKLTIEGMTCWHCAQSVREALLECDGVVDATVDLSSGQATVFGADFDLAAIRRSIEELGYNVMTEGDP